MAALLDSPLPDFRPLAEALRLTARLVALESQTTLMQFALWRALRRRRTRYRALQRRVEVWLAQRRPHAREIDPDDALTSDFLALQREIRVTLAVIETLPAPPRLWQRWMNRRTTRELRAIHHVLGALRTRILEHDADCSPVLDGRFDSADDLIAALERDAAR